MNNSRSKRVTSLFKLGAVINQAIHQSLIRVSGGWMNYQIRWYQEAGLVFMTFNLDYPEIGYNEDPEQQRRNKALRCAMIKASTWSLATSLSFRTSRHLNR